MDDKITPCSKQREILMEVFLSDAEKANLPSELNHHLQRCSSCSHYWSSLSTVRSSYPQDRLYSPFLRAKTLRRMAEKDQAFKIGWMPIVIPAALLSLSFSFVLPVWLMAKLFMYWDSSIAVAYGTALAILLAGGTLVTLVSAISLMERGYIHFGDEDVMQGRAGLPSAAGIIDSH
jgi:hypothetical protein